MNKPNKIVFPAVLFLAGLSPLCMAQSHLEFAADVELNTDAKQETETDTTYAQNGRLAFNLLSEHKDGDRFVLGKGTAVFKKDGEVGADDVFAQFGASQWDLQVGRFEAASLFAKGKDLIVELAGDTNVNGDPIAKVYEANWARGRSSGKSQLAYHFKPTDRVMLELGSIFDGDSIGVRPTVTFANDTLSLSAGYERVDHDTDGLRQGYGVTAGLATGEIDWTASLAYGEDETGGLGKEQITSASLGLTRGGFGVGVLHSITDVPDQDDEASVSAVYAAYTMNLLGMDNASLSFGASHSLADNAGDNDSVTAFRMRINYAL